MPVLGRADSAEAAEPAEARVAGRVRLDDWAEHFDGHAERILAGAVAGHVLVFLAEHADVVHPLASERFFQHRGVGFLLPHGRGGEELFQPHIVLDHVGQVSHAAVLGARPERIRFLLRIALDDAVVVEGADFDVGATGPE